MGDTPAGSSTARNSDRGHLSSGETPVARWDVVMTQKHVVHPVDVTLLVRGQLHPQPQICFVGQVNG